MPTLIPAASRAMAVFEVFAREKRELSNSDMARLLSVAESSSLDLLHTLHSLGYLMRTPRTRRFYPTSRLLETARQISENDPLSTLAHEAVEQLNARTNESAFFGVADTTAIKVLAVQPSRLPLRYIVEVGTRAAYHASAMGKALLGLMPDDKVRALMESVPRRKLTDETVVDVDELLAQVSSGRARGWYEAHGEGSEGVTGLAVSGWLSGQPVGLSVAGPAERMKKNHDAYLEALRDVRNSMLSEHDS
ncbi:IclR family transcriptional regulator [Cupriavidus necator]|uniref:IclR family transcriptional regulator n=1 Tax=Cupriavidus necator TaxID=106590 RepID=A0A367PK70_CUPNE|nr:IclR family transcriptional regulator [Cupriavidus necator]QQX82817.1 IclR family transcriptional regulator [Cupriavidus necator]RCJ07445.1 IclR family transcriptional regulator [Cupriavidus necator]